jgi:hypothetical protein
MLRKTFISHKRSPDAPRRTGCSLVDPMSANRMCAKGGCSRVVGNPSGITPAPSGAGGFETRVFDPKHGRLPASSPSIVSCAIHCDSTSRTFLFVSDGRNDLSGSACDPYRGGLVTPIQSLTWSLASDLRDSIARLTPRNDPVDRKVHDCARVFGTQAAPKPPQAPSIRRRGF